METKNLADENFKKLAELFPNAVTESINSNGNVVRAIKKDILMQEISCEIVEGNEECFRFTWPRKKESILLANKPINKTLRINRDESFGKNGLEGKLNSENLYIEGDNLDVLKLLQETYLEKIKLIYIDPPYNTGNDFIYNDSFKETRDDYLDNSEQFDSNGNRLFKNIESNGRFHSSWINMIYPRLKLAKNLLIDDGTIFISIDVNEQHNLRKICDEVFGEKNFITDIIWNSRKSVSNDAVVSLNHNYTLVYSKNITVFYKNKKKFKLKDEGVGFSNPDNDQRGPWKADPFDSPGIRPNLTYPIKNPNTGEEFLPAQGRCWRTGEKEYLEFLKDNRIVFGKNGTSKPQLKRFLYEAQDKGMTPKSLWDDCGTATEGTKEIVDLMNCKIFDTPKPTKFIKKIVDLSTDVNDYNTIVLDFFSGSATTAHAVMQLNAEDGGHRKFIMVQVPEETDEKSEAYKAGYKNICEIGKERIRRAGRKIKEENPLTTQDLDIGFRVLKCDSSNMKDVYYDPDSVEQRLISDYTDNIKEDRTPEDLLFQVMLELGVDLSSSIEVNEINGKKVFNVAEGYLMASFDDSIDEKTITEVAKQRPYYFVMRDSSMASDSVATNFEQIFNTYSPDTIRKVL